MNETKLMCPLKMYYDLKKNQDKIEEQLNLKEYQEILLGDLSEYKLIKGDDNNG